MPWKTITLAQGRWLLVKELLRARESVRQLCRGLGISRKTAYKWKARFVESGRRGLRDRSRRPHRSPCRTAAWWVRCIREQRRRRRRWGGKKIWARLRSLYPGEPVPAVRTITRWIGRLGLAKVRRRCAPKGPVVRRWGLSPARRPNQVWTVDFKGWWHTQDGQRVEPLTVRDLCSRYVLGVRVLPDQQWWRVRHVFIGLFRQYGLPRVIRADNGGPFGSVGPAGLSRLSAWWVALGIGVEFIRPGHPEENGAHEQMHRELKAEAARPPSSTGRAQQRRLDRWRKHYNQERPHEALGQQTPGQRYVCSARPYCVPLRPWKYPPGWETRRVRSNGQIRWQGRLRFVGEAFVGHAIGLKAKAPGIWKVCFQGSVLGQLHAGDAGGLRPAVYLRRYPVRRHKERKV